MSYEAPPPPGGAYGQPPQGAQRPNSVMAIISLVTGILGIPCCGWFLFSIAAVVLGILGRNETKNGQKSGQGMATAGLILGIVGIVMGIVVTALIIAGKIDVYGDFDFNS